MQNKCAIEALNTNWKIYILETFAMIRFAYFHQKLEFYMIIPYHDDFILSNVKKANN